MYYPEERQWWLSVWCTRTWLNEFHSQTAAKLWRSLMSWNLGQSGISTCWHSRPGVQVSVSRSLQTERCGGTGGRKQGIPAYQEWYAVFLCICTWKIARKLRFFWKFVALLLWTKLQATQTKLMVEDEDMGPVGLSTTQLLGWSETSTVSLAIFELSLSDTVFWSKDPLARSSGYFVRHSSRPPVRCLAVRLGQLNTRVVVPFWSWIW